MTDNAGKICLLNDETKPADEINGVGVQKDRVVYEVIRIIDGVPLFMEDHYLRMKNSLSMLGMELKTHQKDMSSQVRKVASLNNQRNCNVKITIFEEDGRQNCLMYVSKSYYPVKEEIEKGVKVALMHWERNNPNAKVVNNAYKEKARQTIEENNVFEVLLVSGQSKITEGSRSNVFFVRGNRVFTAPDEYVLKGVTRKYIIDACRKSGFEVIETLISVDSLNEIEGLFISGTSIKVLPVSDVDGKTFASSTHPTITAIRDQYDCIVKDYIRRNI